jgi:hypothetical protein
MAHLRRQHIPALLLSSHVDVLFSAAALILSWKAANVNVLTNTHSVFPALLRRHARTTRRPLTSPSFPGRRRDDCPGRNFFRMTYRPLPSTAAQWDRLRGTLGYELPPSPHTGVDAAPPAPHWCRPRSAPKGRFSCQDDCMLALHGRLPHGVGPHSGGDYGKIKHTYISGSAVFNRRCSLTGMIDIRHQSARQ